MIAIDTGILIRYFVQDDPAQAALATRLLEERLTVADPGLVSIVAIHETYWTLLRVYGLAHNVIVTIIAELLNAPNLIIEHRESVQNALVTPVGFADAIIHLTGHANGCTKTVTFDNKFARLEGVELLSA